VNIHEAYSKAVETAKQTVAPKGVKGGYFDGETGELKMWCNTEFEAGTGMIFLHYTEFKYRGDIEEYVKHLEQLIDDLSSTRKASKAEQLINEAAQAFNEQSSISKYSPWAEEVQEFARGNYAG
jgi:hypothetical protein